MALDKLHFDSKIEGSHIHIWYIYIYIMYPQNYNFLLFCNSATEGPKYKTESYWDNYYFDWQPMLTDCSLHCLNNDIRWLWTWTKELTHPHTHIIIYVLISLCMYIIYIYPSIFVYINRRYIPLSMESNYI